MKLDRTVRFLCYLQLAASLILLGYIAIFLPGALEWSRIAKEGSADYKNLISIVRKEGVTGERREPVAALLESQGESLASQPRMYKATFKSAAALAVLISILPVLMLWRSRRGGTDDQRPA